MGTTAALFKDRVQSTSAHVYPHHVEPEAYYEGAIRNRLHAMGVHERRATTPNFYHAVAEVIRAEKTPTWRATEEAYAKPGVKETGYISFEWLLGPNMMTALQSTGASHKIEEALARLGKNPIDVFNHELDPGLGNGGLGRLAACFIDSGANMHLPLRGYGLMYKEGLFRQKIVNGRQVEEPDDWMRDGNPWSVERRDSGNIYPVTLFRDQPLTLNVVPNDMMVPSYDGKTVNTLRLWAIDVPKGYDAGSPQKNFVLDRLNRALYPEKSISDDNKNLWLAQEYVMVSASVQDMVKRHLAKDPEIRNLAQTTSIQINDTHPALAIPELIRVLTTDYKLEWEDAKKITQQVCNYTNHTLMPEALESWHVGTLDYILPEHHKIIDRLQDDLMAEVSQKFAHLSEEERNAIKGRVSIRHGEQVRMGHLAAFYSAKVNGVSAIHTELVFAELFPDLIAMRGEDVKVNHTNGISQRRWLLKANPELAELVTAALGTDEWITNLEMLKGLEAYKDHDAFLERLGEIKHDNKVLTARLIKNKTGVDLDPDAMFDIQIKRIHLYKRQLLDIVHAVALYQDILDNPDADRPKVAKIMGGKAMPYYTQAKEVIELFGTLSNTINNDPRTNGKIKMAFVDDYNVSKAEILIPGADLSEQISTSGTEASGTSNMKFALNGAMTLGTRDGANIEIGEQTGEDNIYFFGMDVDEAHDEYIHGYDPKKYIEASPRLQRAINFMEQQGDAGRAMAHYLRTNDHYMVAADFEDHWAKHQQAQDLYHKDPRAWLQKSLANIIAGSHFSSDRTIKNYNEHNWNMTETIPDEEPPFVPVAGIVRENGLESEHVPAASAHEARL